MAIHTIQRQQLIKSTIPQLWQFFSDPANLAAITPSYMNFRITSPPHKGDIFSGQIITYKISPLLGIPLSWTTEITRVDEHRSFTDEQRKGPYKLWQHTHTFIQQHDGVLMTDEVRYELPLGFMGDIAHAMFVKSQLRGIFDYRYQQIEARFNKTV